VRIIIKNLQKKIPLRIATQKRIKKAIRNTLSLKGRKKFGEITVCFVDDKKITEINWRYLGIKSATDVISFELTDHARTGIIHADIAVSTDRAVYNAGIFNTNPLYEMYLYVVHGVLHLLGYDDGNRRQRQLMDKEAARILSVSQLDKG